MQDKADRLSDQVEESCLSDCAGLYNDALMRGVKRFAPVFKALREVETRKPPSTCETPEQQEEWREGERRRILSKSGMANGIARELAAAGGFAAERILKAMDDIDRINRVVDDIG